MKSDGRALTDKQNEETVKVSERRALTDKQNEETGESVR